MKAIERFMRSNYSAYSALFVILFVSIGRHLLDTSKKPVLSASLHQGVYGVSVCIFFYTILFFLFAGLLTVVLRRTYEQVANAACVGILFGLMPPIVDFFLGNYQYADYFYSFSLSMSSEKQSVGETVVCWLATLAAGPFIYSITRSIWRALFGCFGVYLILQSVGSVIIIIMIKLSNEAPNSMIPFYWNNAAYVVISWALYVLLRGRPLFTSLMRTNHALPFVLLFLCGNAWAGFEISEATFRAVILFSLFFVLLIHNDYYDRKEDMLADRRHGTSADDVVWSTFLFLQGVLLAVNQAYIVFSMLVLLGLLAGFFYHHPSMRIKERFCLSYKIEGVWALTSFLCGAFGSKEYSQEVSLLIPSILAFGGGTLVSIPKDWKDLASDLESKIPTYYVIMVRRGIEEQAAHKRIVLGVTLGLLLPSIALFFLHGVSALLILYFLSSFIPALVLLMVRDRKRAVELLMWAISLNVFFLLLVLVRFPIE